MADLLVKICGLTSRGDAEAAIAAGADLVGFVFVPGGPRALERVTAGWVRAVRGAERVGVFRDASLEEILAVRDELALDRVQLHGDEPDRLLDVLGPGTIRRLRPGDGVDWQRIARLGARCLPLLDPGDGDGRGWDWQALGPPPPEVRFGLAGGLTPERVGEAVRALRPALVDVSSGVERAPGQKDPDRMAAFVRAARAAARLGPARRIG